MRWLGLKSVVSLVILAVMVAAGSAGAREGGRKLSEEQIKKLKERMAKRQAARGGKAGGKLTPGKASLSLVAAAYKEGEAAFKAENFAGAFEHFIDVAACKDIKGAAGYAEKSRARLLEMEKMAAAKLAEARLAKLKVKGPEALEIVKLLLEKFPYCRAAGEAADLLMTLRSDPRVAAAVELLEAEELDKAGKYPEAAAAYAAVMKKYPDSVQALKAKLRLKAMKADEEIAKAIEEGATAAAAEECPKIMVMARNYAMNELPAQARALYQKIIRKYPDSDYAKEAREKLAALKKAPKPGARK